LDSVLESLVKPVELTSISFGKRLKLVQRLGDFSLLLFPLERKDPWFTRVSVWFRITFRGDISKRKSVTGDFGRSAKGDRNRAKPTLRQFHRDRWTVLDLNWIDPRTDSSKNAFYGTQDVEHHVYGMNGVAEQGTPKLSSQLSAPWIGVVFPRSAPGHIHVKYKGFTREFLVNQVFELLQTVAKAILKNWHQRTTSFRCQTRKRIHG